MKTTYVGMCADLIHTGHLNIIKEAQKYGQVIVGVLSDEAIINYKRIPALDFESRKQIVESLKGVYKVVAQKTLSYVDNLNSIKPNYVVHGDDWKYGVQKRARQEVIETLKLWGGELIEVPYTEGISSTLLHENLKGLGTTPASRIKKLRKLIEAKKIVRIIEVHNGLTGLIVENTSGSFLDENRIFDGMWLSSLTHSASKGKPDIQYVDITSVSNTLGEIFEVSTKPMIVDADSGGLAEHFMFMVRTLERLGVSAVIIEDKVGSKKNSLFAKKLQDQDTIENFSKKISGGKRAQVTNDFMIIARVESLILGKGQKDALKRSLAYIEAGADAIMIHSKKESPLEIKSFCSKFRSINATTPLVVVPTTYNSITETELSSIGVNVVIYANHLLRSAYPAMVKTCQTILNNERSLEAQDCMPISEIINLIPSLH